MGSVSAAHQFTIDLVAPATPSNTAYLPVHLKAKLRDSHGTEATVWLGGMQELQHVIRANVRNDHRTVLSTISVPMSAFLAVAPTLDVADLDRLTLRAPSGSTGQVHIDNIEFRGP